MRIKLKLLVAVFFLLFPVHGSAEAKKEYPFWRLVAKSYLIVEGKMSVPAAAIQKAEKTGEHDYVEVPVAVTSWLKGNTESPKIIFRYYTDHEYYGGVSRRKIIQWNGKAVILFLQKVQGRYYLTDYTPVAMQSADNTLAARIRQETAHQEQLIVEFESFAAAHVLPKESELQSLIELMVDRRMDPAGAQAVYEAVIDLGKEVVPTLIKYMDDRRKLTIPKITLVPWWPDASEGLMHYGPETVTDVLSIALMVLTGEDLTAIYNGGTELERAQAVRTWKIYERRTYGKPVKH